MNSIKKIVIVGGGTAGWIAASLLRKKITNPACEIKLIESKDIGIIGVGESTIPPFIDLLDELEIDKVDFIRRTHSAFKLGIEFVDWKSLGESYFHPFGRTGVKSLTDRVFFQTFQRLRLKNQPSNLMDYSIAAHMAKQNKFVPNDATSKSALSDLRYSLHVDATLLAKYLLEFACNLGVLRVEGIVQRVNKRSADGFIESVTMQSGEIIEADFFIDCTGFSSLLLGDACDVGFEDWSSYLLCDRAIVVQSALGDSHRPYTRAIAHNDGWVWQIPLQNRVGNGYVYSSKFCDDETAKATLYGAIKEEVISSAKVISFRTGVREDFWHKNCVALGLAAGFVEPLESTAIHLVIRGVIHLLNHFPHVDCSELLIGEYNKRMYAEYVDVRDFIVLHYCTTQRTDTEFWRACKDIAIPPSLRSALDLYSLQGEIPPENMILFKESSWWAVLDGMGVRPSRYNSLIDGEHYESLAQLYKSYPERLHQFVQGLPEHSQFIKSNCSIDA